MTRPQDELVEVLSLYRDLGFFAQRNALSDSDLAAELGNEYRQSSPLAPEFKTDYPGWDIALLARDEDRTWWYDPETVHHDDRVYAELLERLARISRGMFQPNEIAEVWDGLFGPIHVRFRVAGQQHQIDLGEMKTDFMDPDFLGYVEPLVKASTPYEVVHLCTGDQTDCIVLLTPSERERLQRERSALFDFENAYG
jgi:hypothetical protein